MRRDIRGIPLAWSFVLIFWAQAVWGQLPPNTLRYVENAVPLGLDPITGTGTAIGVRLVDLIFDGMTSYDEFGDPARSLAETFIFSGSTVVVRLKPGATWHDGRPITPEDVRYSYDAYVHKESPYKGKDLFSVFEEVRADDREIRIKYVPGLADTAMMAMLDFDLLPQYSVQDPTVYVGSPFSQNPVGAGPYRLVRAQENKVSLTAHRPYHAGGPRIDGVEMHVQPSDAVHSFMVSAGAVDLDPVIRPLDVSEAEADRNSRLEFYDSQSWSGIAFNYAHPLLRFERVRRALTMAFDRQSALRSFYAGLGQVISGPFALSSFAYDHNIRPWSYNRTEARGMLEDMGFTYSQEEGVLVLGGKDLELNMVLQGSLPDADKNVCADFGRQLESIGVKVNINYIANDSLYAKIVYDRHEFDLTFVTWKFDVASNIYPLFSSSGAFNFIQFQDAQMQTVLEDFRGARSIDEKAEAGKLLHRLLHEKSPYLFLWSLQYAAQYNRRVRNVRVHPFFFFTFVHTWCIKGTQGCN